LTKNNSHLLQAIDIVTDLVNIERAGDRQQVAMLPF